MICNDIVGFHSDFIRQLSGFQFSADFYENLMGLTDIGAILHSSCDRLAENHPNCAFAFFLNHQDTFDIYQSDNEPTALAQNNIIDCFDKEIINQICLANRICTLDELYGLGLAINPKTAKDISLVVVPIANFEHLNCVLVIYSEKARQLTTDGLSKIASITPGLCRAIRNSLYPQNV